MDFYGTLDDDSVNSLARDAGEWAQAGIVPTRSKDGEHAVATFAGGCFWGTELHFQRLPGVIAEYKQSCVEIVPHGVAFVTFPLQPKPHDYPSEWVRDRWV